MKIYSETKSLDCDKTYIDSLALEFHIKLEHSLKRKNRNERGLKQEQEKDVKEEIKDVKQENKRY